MTIRTVVVNDAHTSRRIMFLRASYLVGAVIDGLAILQMLFPSVFAATYGIRNFEPRVEYKYALGIGASLMIGWTFLLIWASQKPIERKRYSVVLKKPLVSSVPETLRGG